MPYVNELAGEDWENACHELLWENDLQSLFTAVQSRALELMREREDRVSKKLNDAVR